MLVALRLFKSPDSVQIPLTSISKVEKGWGEQHTVHADKKYDFRGMRGAGDWLTAIEQTRASSRQAPPPVEQIAPRQQPPPPRQQQAPPRAAGAGFCPSCGNPLRSQDKFCPECGANTQARQSNCPKCGGEVEANQKFCNSCGAPLR